MSGNRFFWGGVLRSKPRSSPMATEGPSDRPQKDEGRKGVVSLRH